MEPVHVNLAMLIKSVDRVIDASGAKRVNGKVSSIRTVEITKQVMRETCRRLHGLGFYITDIESLKEKHIEAIVKDWHKSGLSNKTIQNQLSRLRVFAGWLGKSEIIKAGGIAEYLPEVDPKELKVKTFTEKSKSWTGNGVDLVKIIGEAKKESGRLYAMLLLGVSFGLRKKEMLRIKPWSADAGHELRIDGSVAKNGRFRSIPIDTGKQYGKFQRWCLDQAKLMCSRSETLGWPELQYKQSVNRFSHHMAKLGVTKIELGISAHGLRAEYTENMGMILGLVPPSLGGEIDQMARAERVAIADAVSKLVGHNTDHTLSAYWSTFRPIANTGCIGSRVGSILVVNSDKDIFATLHANPAPIQAKDGSYRLQSKEERAGTAITCVLEVPGVNKHEHIDVARFIQRYPHLGEKIQRTLTMVGLGEFTATTKGEK